jgi:hypothetical protein
MLTAGVCAVDICGYSPHYDTYVSFVKTDPASPINSSSSLSIVVKTIRIIAT